MHQELGTYTSAAAARRRARGKMPTTQGRPLYDECAKSSVFSGFGTPYIFRDASRLMVDFP